MVLSLHEIEKANLLPHRHSEILSKTAVHTSLVHTHNKRMIVQGLLGLLVGDFLDNFKFGKRQESDTKGK